MIKPNLRPAPAFQEYASDLLANREFRLMGLAQRGLLMTMRLECWVNKSVPSDKKELALMLGVHVDELDKHLTTSVLSFFSQTESSLICPELEAYRQNQEARKTALSMGGRNGGKATQSKIREAKAKLEEPLKPRLETKAKPLSRNELIRDEKTEDELTREESLDKHKEWLAEYGDGNLVPIKPTAQNVSRSPNSQRWKTQ